jgi:hypothetical protein
MTTPVYDAPNVGLTGNVVSVDWYRADPRRIYRYLRTVVQARLISDKMLTGRVNLTGTGAGIYEVSEGIYAVDDPQVIAPLTEYPIVSSGRPTLAQVKPVKRGFREEHSDEAASHTTSVVVFERKLRKMANSLVRQQDTLNLSAIASLVTQTQAATSGTWDAANKAGDPFLDVELGAAQIDELDMGYSMDTIACRPSTFAYAVSRAAIMNFLPRETAGNIITAGINNVRIGNYTWWKTTHMPSGVQAIGLDSTMLGSLAYEEIPSQSGPRWIGSAGDDNSGGVQVQVLGEPNVDGITTKSRIVRAPMVQEPNAAIVFTGIRS